jgi:hypothetical protein
VIEYAVDVVWPGNHCRGMLQYPPEGGSSLGGPVLVMDGKPYEAPVLPEGCRVLVVWREARTGPVWELIHRAVTTGQFPIEILEDEMDEGIYLLMAEITLLRSQLAQKDIQVAALDQRLHESQVLVQQKQLSEPSKKPWWPFWKR